MDRDVEQGVEFLEMVLVERVVLYGEEVGAAIIAALDDVGRNACEGQAGTAGHRKPAFFANLIRRV